MEFFGKICGGLRRNLHILKISAARCGEIKLFLTEICGGLRRKRNFSIKSAAVCGEILIF